LANTYTRTHTERRTHIGAISWEKREGQRPRHAPSHSLCQRGKSAVALSKINKWNKTSLATTWKLYTNFCATLLQLLSPDEPDRCVNKINICPAFATKCSISASIKDAWASQMGVRQCVLSHLIPGLWDDLGVNINCVIRPQIFN